LKKYASSENRNGQRRIYKDVLGGRFRLTKVIRIDRKDDGNEVHGKIFDYSRTTIENLMKDGYCDALTKIGIDAIKDGFMEIQNKDGRLEDDLKQLKQQFQQIESSIRVENGFSNLNIIDQIEGFTDKVESMQSIKEEKTLLVNAAKQFKEILIEVNKLNRLP
jgi:hypothetical protein